MSSAFFNVHHAAEDDYRRQVVAILSAGVTNHSKNGTVVDLNTICRPYLLVMGTVFLLISCVCIYAVVDNIVKAGELTTTSSSHLREDNDYHNLAPYEKIYRYSESGELIVEENNPYLQEDTSSPGHSGYLIRRWLFFTSISFIPSSSYLFFLCLVFS